MKGPGDRSLPRPVGETARRSGPGEADAAEFEKVEGMQQFPTDIRLIEKHVNLRNYVTMKTSSGTRYFIPYKVKDHSSDKPTVTDSYVDNCNNVHYSVEYEIVLVAGDDFKRYITVEYETEGRWASCFFDQIENIEEMFEEWFEDGTNGFRNVEDEYKTVTFYDETGENCDIEISSVGELMSMITSIRVIKCDHKIIDQSK